MRHKYVVFAVLSSALAGCDLGGDGRNRVNAAPVLSAIVDQSTSANLTSAPIAFTVSDEDVDSITFAITSDNQDLVADTALVLGGSGQNRTITVTPTVDMLGDSMITIIATDTAGLSAATSFLLTIDPEQKSLQQFTRSAFFDDADGEPALVNAVEFTADADNDDFADLLAQ